MSVAAISAPISAGPVDIPLILLVRGMITCWRQLPDAVPATAPSKIGPDRPSTTLLPFIAQAISARILASYGDESQPPQGAER